MTQGHREKWVQKSCVSFEEECNLLFCVGMWHFSGVRFSKLDFLYIGMSGSVNILDSLLAFHGVVMNKTINRHQDFLPFLLI